MVATFEAGCPREKLPGQLSSTKTETMNTHHFKAALYSTKAGYHKKAFAYCAHEHDSYVLASVCASRLQKTNANNRRWWKVIEVVLRPVERAQRRD